jgi:hypothetical protein
MAVRVRRPAPGTVRFTRRLPGRELAAYEAVIAGVRWEACLRDDGCCWRRPVASALTGAWRDLGSCWVLVADVRDRLGAGEDPELLLGDVLRAQGHRV